MDGNSYTHPFQAPNTPMATPTSATYKPDVTRKKTRKWVEAKSLNYDGDDWGSIEDEEDDDEDEKENAPAAPQPLPPYQRAAAAAAAAASAAAAAAAAGTGPGSADARSQNSASPAISLESSHQVARSSPGFTRPSSLALGQPSPALSSPRSLTGLPHLHVDTSPNPAPSQQHRQQQQQRSMTAYTRPSSSSLVSAHSRSGSWDRNVPEHVALSRPSSKALSMADRRSSPVASGSSPSAGYGFLPPPSLEYRPSSSPLNSSSAGLHRPPTERRPSVGVGSGLSSQATSRGPPTAAAQRKSGYGFENTAPPTMTNTTAPPHPQSGPIPDESESEHGAATTQAQARSNSQFHTLSGFADNLSARPRHLSIDPVGNALGVISPSPNHTSDPHSNGSFAPPSDSHAARVYPDSPALDSQPAMAGKNFPAAPGRDHPPVSVSPLTEAGEDRQTAEKISAVSLRDPAMTPDSASPPLPPLRDRDRPALPPLQTGAGTGPGSPDPPSESDDGPSVSQYSASTGKNSVVGMRPAPLQPRPNDYSPASFEEPRLIQRRSTYSSVATSSPAKESDKLREEIMKSLSPAGSPPDLAHHFTKRELGPLAEHQYNQRHLPPPGNGHRETDVARAANIYADWFGRGGVVGGGPSSSAPGHPPKSSPAPVSGSGLGPDPARPGRQERENHNQRRFSWDGGRDGGGAHAHHQINGSAATAATAGAAAAATSAEPALSNGNLPGSSDQGSLTTRAVSPTVSIGLADPAEIVSRQASSVMSRQQWPLGAGYPGSVMVPHEPPSPSSVIEASNSSPLSAATAGGSGGGRGYGARVERAERTEVRPQNRPAISSYHRSAGFQKDRGHIPAFDDIARIPIPAERIAKYNAARQHIETIDSGLAGWLEAMRRERPEYADIFEQANAAPTRPPYHYQDWYSAQATHRPVGPQSQPSSPPQQPYYRQHLDSSNQANGEPPATQQSPTDTAVLATAVGALAPAGPRPMPGGGGTGSDFKSNPHNAGGDKAVAGAAAKVRKGFFSKSKAKLKGAGDKQKDGPTSPQSKPRSDRRTSWSIASLGKSSRNSSHWQHHSHDGHVLHLSDAEQAEPHSRSARPSLEAGKAAESGNPLSSSADISNIPPIPSQLQSTHANRPAPGTGTPWSSREREGAGAMPKTWSPIEEEDDDDMDGHGHVYDENGAARGRGGRGSRGGGARSNGREEDWIVVGRSTHDHGGRGNANLPPAEDGVPHRHPSFVGLPPIRRTSTFSTFGMAMNQRTGEETPHQADSDDDGSGGGTLFAIPPSGMRSGGIEAPRRQNSMPHTIQEGEWDNGDGFFARRAGAGWRNGPEDDLPTPRVSQQTSAGAIGQALALTTATTTPAGSGSSNPTDHFVLPPFASPGGGTWKLEESHLQEPLHQSRSRAPTTGSPTQLTMHNPPPAPPGQPGQQQHNPLSYDKETGLPLDGQSRAGRRVSVNVNTNIPALQPNYDGDDDEKPEGDEVSASAPSVSASEEARARKKRRSSIFATLRGVSGSGDFGPHSAIEPSSAQLERRRTFFGPPPPLPKPPTAHSTTSSVDTGSSIGPLPIQQAPPGPAFKKRLSGIAGMWGASGARGPGGVAAFEEQDPRRRVQTPTGSSASPIGRERSGSVHVMPQGVPQGMPDGTPGFRSRAGSSAAVSIVSVGAAAAVPQARSDEQLAQAQQPRGSGGKRNFLGIFGGKAGSARGKESMNGQFQGPQPHQWSTPPPSLRQGPHGPEDLWPTAQQQALSSQDDHSDHRTSSGDALPTLPSSHPLNSAATVPTSPAEQQQQQRETPAERTALAITTRPDPLQSQGSSVSSAAKSKGFLGGFKWSSNRQSQAMAPVPPPNPGQQLQNPPLQLQPHNYPYGQYQHQRQYGAAGAAPPWKQPHSHSQEPVYGPVSVPAGYAIVHGEGSATPNPYGAGQPPPQSSPASQSQSRFGNVPSHPQVQVIGQDSSSPSAEQQQGSPATILPGAFSPSLGSPRQIPNPLMPKRKPSNASYISMSARAAEGARHARTGSNQDAISTAADEEATAFVSHSDAATGGASIFTARPAPISGPKEEQEEEERGGPSGSTAPSHPILFVHDKAQEEKILLVEGEEPSPGLLQVPEEKIAVDPEGNGPVDEPVVMSATSYPGQEWNPYGDFGYDGWDD